MCRPTHLNKHLEQNNGVCNRVIKLCYSFMLDCQRKRDQYTLDVFLFFSTRVAIKLWRQENLITGKGGSMREIVERNAYSSNLPNIIACQN